MRKSNQELQRTIEVLRRKAREDKSNVWLRLAEDLTKPTRARVIVNIAKISKYAQEGETIVVPGKVLATGDLDKNVTVVAWQFSGNAKRKIALKGKAFTFDEALDGGISGTMRIMG